MSWGEAIAWVLVAAGLFAGAFIFASRPAFWIEMGSRLIVLLGPKVVAFLTKRMTPEKEAEYRDCVRRGGQWDFARKRCRDPR